MQDDGRFDGTNFSNWLKQVKELCIESGHLGVALYHIGEIFIHCPADVNGLWINRTAEAALNTKDADKMRDGFSIGERNSRGGQYVDPTGKPERELAEKYRQQAEEIENVGYHRLAAMLRDLAKDYDRDAERIINQYIGKKNSPLIYPTKKENIP